MYDIRNLINHTFYTELNPKIPNLGPDPHRACRYKLDSMITPPKSLKFKVQKDEYRENVVIQLERINSEKPIKVKSGKVTNFSILTTRQQNRIGNKRTMPYEIIDQ